MEISFAGLAAAPTGAVVLGVREDRVLVPATAQFDSNAGGLLQAAMASSRFSGKAHQTLTVFAPGGRVLLYGLGNGEGIDRLWCERAGGSIVAALAKSGESAVSVVFDGIEDDKTDEMTRAARIAFGARLRAYRFDRYRTKLKDEDKPSLERLVVHTTDPDGASKQYGPLGAVGDGVCLARDLVSEPPNVLHPESYAERLRSLADDGLTVEVLDEPAMADLGMNALLGVGQGSRRESRLVVLRWDGGAPEEQPLALVGKGVCFDTGGISIKPASGMEAMKWDMGGSAVVVGVMKALARRQAAVNAVGVVGLVENMPDGNAQRPGDIVTSMSGQTIEIINTDAEGRLVLADALWYTRQRFNPRFMIDLATLTGAMLVSLGEVNCGYFANNDELSDQLAAAARASGEKVWRMPLGDEYNKMMDSDVADMKNAGPRYAGSITAACFIERFVEDCPWIHMDIAGMAWSSKDAPTVPKGGTGWGVRLLNDLIETDFEH